MANGSAIDHTNPWGLSQTCQELDLPKNAVEIVYSGHVGAPWLGDDSKLTASVECHSGFLAGGTESNKQQVECIADSGPVGMYFYWSDTLLACEKPVFSGTCPDPTPEIQSGDDIDVSCTLNAQGMKYCEMRCHENNKRLKNSIMPGTNKMGEKTQKRANIKCRCRKGVCKWASHGVFGVDLSGKFYLL